MSLFVTETEVAGGNTDSRNNKSRSVKTWVFTLNNYTEADCIMFSQWKDDVTRMVVSKEIGESGTEHLQGAITFKNTKRLSALKKLHSQAHWEIALASDCFIYPIKEWSEVIIDINNKKQGTRNDWLEVKTMIKNNKSIKDIAEAQPHIYSKLRRTGIQEMADDLCDDRPIKPIIQRFMDERKVIWLWGPTGVGKTKYIIDKHGYKDTWLSGLNSGGNKFNGYKGQSVAILDDLRCDCFKFRELLRLLDKHPLILDIKYGHILWTPEFIYVTSCKHPKDLYNPNTFDNDEKVDQLLRRITEIIHLNNEDESHLSSLIF